MDLSTILANIMHVIDDKYSDVDECVDIEQLRKICSLYNTKKIRKKSGNIEDVEFSTPDYSKIEPKKNSKAKKNVDINTPEFKKVYTLFVKIVYTCFELDIELFDTVNDSFVMKNNYYLLKAIRTAKRGLLVDHMSKLAKDKKKLDIDIDEYEKYVSLYISKIKICDKLYGWIDLFEKNDNLFNLILPYFYTYNKYIEEYEG